MGFKARKKPDRRYVLLKLSDWLKVRDALEGEPITKTKEFQDMWLWPIDLLDELPRGGEHWKWTLSRRPSISSGEDW